MTIGKVQAPASDDVPEEHREAYAEMCDQFRRAVLQAFSDAQMLTIMRDLPPSLQINSLIVGAGIGSLTPLLMMTKRGGDFQVAQLMAQSAPKIVTEARKFADQCAEQMPTQGRA